jgi:putative ABC transport system ATP-binding protein
VTTPTVELVDAARTYPGPPAVPAFKPCRLVIHPGEYVTVVGPSGSGKSTFLNVIGLLDRPTAGRYLLDGIDTGGLAERERAALRGRRIGFVFQAFHLLGHRSSLANVMLPLAYTGVPQGRRRRIALQALDRVGLSHRALVPARQLSGGERQRAAVARALVNEPRLLLCDEPTGNLDTATAGTIFELLAGLRRAGMTVLVVTHDPGIASSGDRCLVIRDGLLQEAPRVRLADAAAQTPGGRHATRG